MASDEQQGLGLPGGRGGQAEHVDRRPRAWSRTRCGSTDPTGARAAEQATDWRTDYLVHFRRLVEAGLGLAGGRGRRSPGTGWTRCTSGCGSLGPGRRGALARRVAGRPADRSSRASRSSATGEPVDELVLPYHGDRLRGRRASVAGSTPGSTPGWSSRRSPTAVEEVLANPDWLRLEGHTVAVLGRRRRDGSAAVADAVGRPGRRGRPRPAGDLGAGADAGHGRRRDAGRAGAAGAEPRALEEVAGVDLLAEVPAVERWLQEQPGTLVIGNYVYADGATNARVSMAVDELTTRLQAESRRRGARRSWRRRPTCSPYRRRRCEHSTRAYDGRSARSKTLGRPLRALSGGRLLRRNYVRGLRPRHQRLAGAAAGTELRAGQAAAALAGDRRPPRTGALVSMNVAPPTRTRSVVKNRALAAAYAGAHRFGVEVFEPATSNVLMAALLVHDLHTGGGPRHEHPWQDEAYAAAHGGLWRAPYAPRSALGLAALLGYGAARG